MNNELLIKEIILERNPKAKFLEKEFDKALIGSTANDKEYVAVYDSEECINILVKKFNIEEIEAIDHLSHITKISWLKKNRPILFSDFRKIKDIKITKVNEKILISNFD